uniref:Uncharacterized protein n=1 Tax=Laticauda laticaudata TaxID=8630 RepID=A0A8C5SWK8_LATLA
MERGCKTEKNTCHPLISDASVLYSLPPFFILSIVEHPFIDVSSAQKVLNCFKTFERKIYPMRLFCIC